MSAILTILTMTANPKMLLLRSKIYSVSLCINGDCADQLRKSEWRDSLLSSSSVLCWQDLVLWEAVAVGYQWRRCCLVAVVASTGAPPPATDPLATTTASGVAMDCAGCAKHKGPRA